MDSWLNAPGSLFAIKYLPLEQSNLYLNIGSTSSVHNGDKTVEVNLIVRAAIGITSPMIESGYDPGWASRMMQSDIGGRKLA